MSLQRILVKQLFSHKDVYMSYFFLHFANGNRHVAIQAHLPTISMLPSPFSSPLFPQPSAFIQVGRPGHVCSTFHPRVGSSTSPGQKRQHFLYVTAGLTDPARQSRDFQKKTTKKCHPKSHNGLDADCTSMCWQCWEGVMDVGEFLCVGNKSNGFLWERKFTGHSCRKKVIQKMSILDRTFFNMCLLFY